MPALIAEVISGKNIYSATSANTAVKEKIIEPAHHTKNIN